MGDTETADLNGGQGTATANQNGQIPAAVRWCVPTCKFDGKTKKGTKSLDMTRCCFCMYWFHDECMKLKKEENVIWYCTSCRLMPANISKLLNEISAMREDINTLVIDNHVSQESLKKIETKCDDLTKENATLRTQVTSLSNQLQQKVWQTFTNNDHQSLLIGDSLIRNVDEQKLVNTQVTSLPGAKVTDVLKHLRDNDADFNNILCCVGTNDCTNDDFDGDAIAKTYKSIVEIAKAKVSDPKSIKLVSIPPRCDSKTYQERVDTLNACLASIATDDGLTFINNDSTFKLGDGTPNDGYLLNDGIHLSDKGTNRLVRNMQLKVNQKAINGNVVKKKQQNTKQLRDTRLDSAPVNVESNWKEVPYRRSTRPPFRRSAISDGQRPNVEYGDRADHGKMCWFCGERNHISTNCRHGKRIFCYTCQGEGHKAKFCSQ